MKKKRPTKKAAFNTLVNFAVKMWSLGRYNNPGTIIEYIKRDAKRALKRAGIELDE